ncbi:MAG: M12 family metallo-peptidase [Saprospiraceae bacterium]
MKKILTTTFNTFIVCLLFGQQVPNFWKQVQHHQVFLPEKSETVTMPDNYLIYSLDLDEMRNYLRDAPMEGTEEAFNSNLLVKIPLPDGSFETFITWESPILHPDLGAKYPTIKTFAGKGVENPSRVVRFGFSLAGFHAIVPSENGGAITESYATNQDQYYITYAHSGFLFENLNIPAVKYIVEKEASSEHNPASSNWESEVGFRGGGDGALTERRDYLFVLACTGEFGQMHGGNPEIVLGKLAEALNAMNMLLERDIDVRFTMHPNNDQVVYTNPAADPYTNANQGGALLSQNQTNIDNVIGVAGYDVGHVYTGPCTDVGGVVSGTVCATGKARGVTCNFSTSVIQTTLSIAAHEIMHQFSGGHTFNYCPGQEGQFSSSSAWEPGSGSTILSYQGSCGQANNVPGPATLQYHAGNIDEVWSYTRFQGGNVCVNVTQTSNHSPVVTENYLDGFYIPIGTPFELEVSATDADGDALTYSWEQMNRTPSSPVGSPVGDAPTFRVYDHTTSPMRVFPKLSTILNNSSDNFEVLPTFSKNLNFRCVVRDNNLSEGAGGVTWQDVSFKATDTAGPFLVSYPNMGGIKWTAGEEVEVTWDVANTDNDLVKCKSVNIWLSKNGGLNFDYLLIASTPNDGSEVITVPEYIGSAIRLRIEAADNIFFDLSNNNFEIQPATDAGFSTTISPQYQQSCVPGNNLVEVEIQSILGFDQPVQLDIVDGLPPNAVVNFSANPVMPGESSIIDFNMNEVTDIGLFEITLREISGTDTLYRSVFLDVVFNDFSAMVLDGPVNGGSDYGLLPTFTWTNLPNADSYDFQLSTTPQFEPDDIIAEEFDLTSTSLLIDLALEENTLYYWRIRPSNGCGKGDFSLKNVFQTFNSSCTLKASTDIPKPISAIGLPVIKSDLTVLETGIIQDVNIKDLKGSHDALADLKVSLISPVGTKVKLFEGICGNVSTFNLDLNDESPFDIDCPPLNSLAYRPQEPLATFIGENTLGNWTLEVAVINVLGSGGTLQGWNIEFCSSVTPEHPFLLENDTIYVKPNETRVIHNYELFAADPDDIVSVLKVNIIDETKFGYISKDGTPLGVGDSFTFKDINQGLIKYTNTDPDAVYDFFTFTVTDGHGGLLGTPKFNIVIDEDALTDVNDLEPLNNELALYPNPVTDLLSVVFKSSLTSDATVIITDMQGRLLTQQVVSQQTEMLQLNMQDFANGIYFMSVQTDYGVMTEKFVVRH